MGAYVLTVTCRSAKELPKTVTVAGVQPLDMQKLTGFVAVSAEEGVQVKSETFDGLTEVPAAVLGSRTPAAWAGRVGVQVDSRRDARRSRAGSWRWRRSRSSRGSVRR